MGFEQQGGFDKKSEIKDLEDKLNNPELKEMKEVVFSEHSAETENNTIEEIKSDIKDFIMNEGVEVFGDNLEPVDNWEWPIHGHLSGYKNEKYWAHYIFFDDKGLKVTLFKKKETPENPIMGGERGEATVVNIDLNYSERKELLDNNKVVLNEGDEQLEEIKEYWDIKD